MAVVGDSKMAQWIPALQPLAEQNGWRLVTNLKSACSFSLAMPENVSGPACRDWTANVLQRLEADPPDYVLTSQGNITARDAAGRYTENAMIAGLHSVWNRLNAVGTKIVVIANNPHPSLPGMEAYECVARTPRSCRPARSTAASTTSARPSCSTPPSEARGALRSSTSSTPSARSTAVQL